LIIRYHHFME